jgi:hypothetical protein
MTAEATPRTAARDRWTRQTDQVRSRAGRAIWHAAETEPDPLAAIEGARRLAADLVDRLVRTTPEGDHLATCLAHGRHGEPGLGADLAMSRRGRRCHTDREGAGTTFGALLVLGALTGAPIGLILRSCRGPCPSAAGHESAGHESGHESSHESTVRGWVVRDRRAQPMSRGAVRTIARAGRRPHPALPQHPEEGTRYEKAYSLYAEGEEG